jgi:HK97 family phage prohead protease
MDRTGDGMTFRGYASVFDAPYPINDEYGQYQETVKRGAFDKTLAEGADVVFLINHEGAPLARTRSNTLSHSHRRQGPAHRGPPRRVEPAGARAEVAWSSGKTWTR